ncbi:MAG: DUF401 family protein [Candidatus Njordarchaeota archaeon]
MNIALIILVFIASVVIILILSTRSLWMSIFLGALLISFICNNPSECLIKGLESIISMEMLLLAFALAEIPIIGKILESDLQNVFGSMNNKIASMLGPATLGLLPIPGGAVLSCPIVEKSLEKIKKDHEKVAINVWFRHILFLVYPLSSSLIVAATVAEIDLLYIIPYMIPVFFVALVIGYLYYFKKGLTSTNNGNLEKKSILPIAIIISAPIIQIFLRVVGVDIDIATFIAVTIVLIASILCYRVKFGDIQKIVLKMKVWNFSLILLAIIFYAKIFSLSQVPQVIRDIRVNVLVISVIIPLALGFLTGRVQLTASLVIPIILYGYGSISVGTFVVVYCAALGGYLMSPAHPCLVLSSEYFHSDVRLSIRDLLIPTFVFVLFSTVYGLFLNMLIG